MVPIVSVVGKKAAGKTLVMTRLVAELKKRGYRVAAVKHSAHSFDVDREGKDSWQYSQAGSDAAVISSPQKVAIIRKVDRDSTLAELSRLIGPDYDIILAEGFKQDKAARIEVHRKELGPDLVSDPGQLLAVVTDGRLGPDLPQFGLDDAAGLADLIEKKYLKKAEKERVSLFVNGEAIPLNDFVRSLFSSTVLGMISSLKRIPKAAVSVDIQIRRKGGE